MHDLEAYCFEALKAGASGYVLKTVADRDLVEACRAAMRGESSLYPPTIRTLMRTYLDYPGPQHRGALSDREEEVTKLVAESYTTEAIAQLLSIGPRTVERHRENIVGKLGMRDRIALTRWAIRQCAGVTRSLASQVVAQRIADEKELGLDTLQARIAEQVGARDAVILPPAVVGAWGTRPSVDP